MSLVWRLLLDLSGSLATFHDIIIHMISVCITNTIIGMIIVDFTVDYFLRTLMFVPKIYKMRFSCVRHEILLVVALYPLIIGVCQMI